MAASLHVPAPVRTTSIAPSSRVEIERLVTPEGVRAALLDAALQGLRGSTAPRLPTTLLYAGDGGRWFSAVAADPRYRLARRERALLGRVADVLAAITAPEHVVELGGGASDKLATVVRAARASLRRVSSVDLDEPGLVEGLRAIVDGSGANVERADAIVADLEHPGLRLPRDGRRLVTLLGSTYGNFDPAGRASLLDLVAATSAPGDCLVLGLDVNRSAFDQVAAYRSAAIARFNREAFATLGAMLDQPLRAADVDHHVRWDEGERAVEVALVPRRDVEIAVADAEPIELRAGERIVTAVSRKLASQQVELELNRAGFGRSTWWFDDAGLHALVLARRS